MTAINAGQLADIAELLDIADGPTTSPTTSTPPGATTPNPHTGPPTPLTCSSTRSASPPTPYAPTADNRYSKHPSPVSSFTYARGCTRSWARHFRHRLPVRIRPSRRPVPQFCGDHRRRLRTGCQGGATRLLVRPDRGDRRPGSPWRCGSPHPTRSKFQPAVRGRRQLPLPKAGTAGRLPARSPRETHDRCR